jgi:hypothetical protein
MILAGLREGRHPSAVGAVVVVVLGVVIVTVAQFYLESVALSDLTWHWIQHGVIAVGGVMVGVGAARLYQIGQPQARLYPSARGSLLVVVLGIGLAVVGQFYIDSLTNASLIWHWLQHGLVFFGGVAVGEGAYGLYLRDQRRFSR